METRASYVLVGAFVLLLGAAIAGFALWLGTSRGGDAGTRYEVAITGSVQGLQEGSAVRYRGVPVGRVAAIRIDPDNIANILLTLMLRPDTPVRTDTVAVVEMQGITGLATVQLRGGSQASPPLEAAEPGATPRIRAGQSALEQVFASTPEILARAAVLLDHVNEMLGPENRANIAAILDDAEELVDGLAESRPHLQQLVVDVGNATRQVDVAAGRIGALAEQLGQLSQMVQGQVGGLGDGARTSLAEVNGAAVAVRQLVQRLDGLVRANGQPVADFSQSGLYQFTQMTIEARQLIAALSRISKELERDPAGYLLGGPQKGYTPP